MGRAFEFRKARKFKRWGQMAKTFTKIGKDIVIAVKAGGGDPSSNSRLRAIIQNAKAVNMPKENVERAIKRATSKDQEDYKEIVYEGYAQQYQPYRSEHPFFFHEMRWKLRNNGDAGFHLHP
jgi:transcriptional/translational regulatory protein YebC/TACO1